jgi:aspartyl-tRNA(Asn)/glutamyl-tRNA(Gln) amidotransferase subunit B
MSQYMTLIKDGKVTASVANQRLWPIVLEKPTQSVESLADELGILINHDEGFLDKIIAEVIAESPNQVKQFKGGKKNLMGFFVGAIMRKSKGSADPKTIQKKLIEALA